MIESREDRLEANLEDALAECEYWRAVAKALMQRVPWHVVAEICRKCKEDQE